MGSSNSSFVTKFANAYLITFIAGIIFGSVESKADW
jgi:hypothetical protein